MGIPDDMAVGQKIKILYSAHHVNKEYVGRTCTLVQILPNSVVAKYRRTMLLLNEDDDFEVIGD